MSTNRLIALSALGAVLLAACAPSPFQSDAAHLLWVGVQGYEAPAAHRQPASLAFVIDVSGSMASENRLQLVWRPAQLWG